MIDPFKEDLGRRVVKEEYVGAPIQRGKITSWNPDFVFVQIDGQAHATTFPREWLHYEEDFIESNR